MSSRATPSAEARSTVAAERAAPGHVPPRLGTRIVRRAAGGRAQEALAGYLFIAPLIVVFGIYYAYAVFRSMWMSFTNDQFVLPQATRFIGLGNYIEAVKDPSVRHGFVVAGVFTVLNYLGAFLFPLLVALVLDRVRNPRLGTLYRVLLYIPAVMPAPLIYRLWAWIFAPSLGLLNYAGYSLLGVFPRQFNWLAEPALILPSLIVIYWWWHLGLYTVFFLIGLAAIPEEFYEAARLDGANELHIVRHVTLPLLRGTLMVWAILLVSVFSVTEPMLVIWGGGGSFTGGGAVPTPAQTWGWYAYALGFLRGNLPMGYASAIGWLGALVMVAVALGVRRLFTERD